MAPQRTIGELAAEAGVPVSTIRFYERQGLLEAAGRSASGYRLYGDACLERVRFIRIAQATGFTLEDIAELVARRPGDPGTRPRVREMLERRLAEVRQRLDELRELESALTRSLAACTRARCGCPVLQELRVSAASGPRAPGAGTCDSAQA